ncbi:maintenance of telomere capping protein 1 [Ilyonectria robusta]|uniref:maintenance of telomere capping protein 1 n=1 Tax=Ilyonectria robusta TaxID=1079257 RepID=UPI001E8E688A|nr:maintenance of telomere capping protein 1 [Ilyonectria robusta]KAH8734646.1 maintenance of telomere capping protein 1 [Ilyonectria robusta]
MASKKTKAVANDDNLDDLFSGIDTKPKKPSTHKSKPTSAASKAIADQDILADLESELASEQPSRPHTPRLKDVAARRSTATPPAGDDRAAMASRKSTDSARSLRTTFTPSATSSDAHESEKKPAVEPVVEEPPAPSTGGGWWGGILSTATATASLAMKQAEAAVSQIQQNEEAMKWAEQVKGLKGIDVGSLQKYGDELRHRALPTFTNILHTLAPPISSHERLLIHITHDIVGYPSLDPLIHGVFARVMSQVEGGDLLVVQRGQESSSRRNNDSAAGWRDGPWWRQADSPRELGLINGLPEGTKLCRASAESYANEYFAATGGLEQAKLRATEDLSETNPVRTSDLFLSVQAICIDEDDALFARTASAEKEKESSDVKDQEETGEIICFAIFILDPVHGIEFSTVSQSVPARWVQWLDAPAPLTPRSNDEGQDIPEVMIPEEIRDIIESGGVDPREWVAEWLEELLDLSVGIVAQRYVARRMGVGEGGLGKGKRRMEDLVEDGGGEAARAGII